MINSHCVALGGGWDIKLSFVLIKRLDVRVCDPDMIDLQDTVIPNCCETGADLQGRHQLAAGANFHPSFGCYSAVLSHVQWQVNAATNDAPCASSTCLIALQQLNLTGHS